MLIVNLIDKDRVRGEDGFGDSRAVWRARLFLFISFALMAGGLAGSVVSVSRRISRTSLSPPAPSSPTSCSTHASNTWPLNFFPLVRLDPQIHPERLPRDVQVLRLLQRLAEHRVDAIRGCALDISEQQWRV
jgi:hypothetical protein